MTEQEVVELMLTSKSEDEWNANTRLVKAAHDGQYPDFWYATIVQSGIARDVASRWGGDDRIHVTAYGGCS